MNERTSQHLGWRLVAESSTVRPAQLPLVGPSWTIGRATDNEVVIAHDAVSRRHALIVREEDLFRLSDVGSRNGTFVNGKIVRNSHILAHRDLIGLGETRPHLRFVDDHAIANPVRGQPSGITHHLRLRYDDQRLRFSIYDRPLDLSPDEFRLLRYLHHSRGTVCSRIECADAIWGADAYRHEDGLDRLIEDLRRKLTHLDPEIAIVQTRITGGFILQL
jgi:hypothetical protein